jgi:hypothetical protein
MDMLGMTEKDKLEAFTIAHLLSGSQYGHPGLLDLWIRLVDFYSLISAQQHSLCVVSLLHARSC